jgi:alpha-galactosidase
MSRAPGLRFKFIHFRLAAGLLLAMSPVATATAAVIAQREDCTITSEGQDTSWTLANGAISYTIGFDDSGRLIARDLRNGGAGRSWNPSLQADSVFEIDGRELRLNRAEVGGFTLTRVEAGQSTAGLELRLVFGNGRDGVQATRVYAIYPSTPIIETWTQFDATTGRTLSLEQIAGLQLIVDGASVTWVRGQESVGESLGFTIEKRQLANGDHQPLESTGRSTQTALPLFALRSTQGVFFGGIVWSGAWRIDLIGQGRQRLEVTIGLGETSTTIATSHPVELPHAIFGVAEGDESAVAPALNRFILGALREGRPFSPLVTFNGWFVSGTHIDRDTIARQMEAAAEAGAEVFQVDAGWYAGAGEQDAFDFSSGLGAWRVDTKKFPDGLAPLGELARSLGMKFGLWVEPERVDLRLVGEPGMPQEAWLAQSNGSYQPGVGNDEARTAMIDFGLPEARAWILDRLTTLITEQGVDYLKWDSNFWVNNTRRTPGRGVSDGNFEHVRGLYLVLAELRARFPNLIIENCSGGGNRLDLGLMRVTDVGWMDDRTAPSSHVRHNLQGLTTFLPPAYLLSYLIAHEHEPMHESPDMALYARSRMPGVFGLSFSPDDLDERDTNAIRAATDLWKAFRDVTSAATAQLLTAQVDTAAAPAWDALAIVAPGREQALVYAFQNDPDSTSTRIILRGLDPQSTYELRSPVTGTAGSATGAALMQAGIELTTTADSVSQLWQLAVAPPDESTPGAP